MEIIEVKAQCPYKVYIGEGILNHLAELLKEIIHREALIYVVTDNNVARFYLKTLIKSLDEEGYKVKFSVFKPGERLKSFNNLIKLLRLMVNNGLTRDSVVIGLGGGVIGDFAGFASSIYMRGCNYVQVPTTLLAQVDSSVGGKVGINLKEGKNFVGSFNSPLSVLCDPGILNTLPPREFLAGLSEVIKYGLIFEKRLFEKLRDFFYKIIPDGTIGIPTYDLKPIILSDKSFIHELIISSVNIKAEIVGRDEREKGLRMILNFGHTFGHAMEKLTHYKRFLHGEAVLLGMKMALELSMLKGLIQVQERDMAMGFLNLFNVPSVRGLTAQSIYNQIGRDKKKKGGKMHYILLKGIGIAVTETDIEEKLILESIERVLQIHIKG